MLVAAALSLACATTLPAVASSLLEQRLATSGIDADALASLATKSESCPAVAASERVSCMGWWERWLNGTECEARGCCFAPSLDTLNWCYYPIANTAEITTVHVVQGCHLDVGFMVR